MGYGGYAGWGDAEANADFNATGGAGKQTGGGGGSSGTGPNIPKFDFNWEKSLAAQTNALSDLSVYYQKLLDIYGGDVALAKQRIDQDYERGLRVKATEADWSTEGIQQQKAERQRQFKIAMRDLDETMNRRGVFTSGLTEQAQQEARAGEQYQMGQLGRQEQEIARGLSQYKEQAATDYQREMEKYGYMKPQVTQTAGQYAPSQVGVTTPGASYNVANYRPETAVKELSLAEEKRKAQIEAANQEMQRAYTQWSSEAQRLAANYVAPQTNLTA